MQLEQVDAVDAQAIQRSVEVLLRGLVVASVRLGGNEECSRVPFEPRGDPELGVTVRRGGIDVIHAVLEKEIQRPLGIRM